EIERVVLPGVHYMPFTMQNVSEVVRYVLAEENAAEMQAMVRRAHTARAEELGLEKGAERMRDDLVRLWAGTGATPAAASVDATGAAVPRGGWPSHSNIIWMLWAQGLDDRVPKSQRSKKYIADHICVRAWMQLYPGPESGWEVRLLDEAEAKLLAPRYAAIRNHPKSEWVGMGAASDLLRADLLSRYGGVWVDTSVCPFQALDDWLPAALEAREGLFIPRAFDHTAKVVMADGETRGALKDMPAAAKTGSELEKFEGCLYDTKWGHLARNAMPLSSWFMAAAAPHDSIIDAWVEILYRRLLEVLHGPQNVHGASRYPYFVAHCSMTMARLRDAAVE
ncbi:MAG: capsular polysaccharide synthesis protein, partial [Planctomycetota bacterium]|nr:capsular polysaccharide synthesis protein [Planctomycetota bacterium]